MSTLIVNKYGWSSSDTQYSHSYLLLTTLQILDHYKVTALPDIGTGNSATIPSWLSKEIL